MIELTQEHIEELDLLIHKVLASDYKVLTEEALEMNFNIPEGKSKFYLEALEFKEVVTRSGVSFYIESERLKIFYSKGGFKALAIEQENDRKLQVERDTRLLEINELQLKQLRHEASQLIFKSIWFWIAAFLILASFILSLLTFLGFGK